MKGVHKTSTAYKEQVKSIFAEIYYIDFRKKKSVPSEKQQEIYSLITDLRKRFLLSHTPDFFTHNSSKPNDCIYGTAQWYLLRENCTATISYRGSPTYMVFTTADPTTAICSVHHAQRNPSFWLI